jgi:S-disulfanyl-L-cysteine oxidoreductase SoxD
MTRLRILPVVLLASVAGVSAAAGTTMRAQTPSSASRYVLAAARDTARIYTEEQATTGQAVFVKTCAECHETKDVTGADFRTKWAGQTVFALFEQIRTTMPDGNPGTLPREEYVATVAYILKLNGLPAGDTPLATDSVALSAVNLELPPPSN